MGSSSSKPDLSANELAVEREKKLKGLMVKWYESVVPGPPPPTDDPNLLRYETKTDYYYTLGLFGAIGKIYDPPPEWFPDPPPKISVDQAAVDRTIALALANTTKDETGEGYGTCVIQSFEGKYYGDACLFKLIVVAVSFNFSASEYKTPLDVAAFGYWIYFLRTPPPFRYDKEGVSESIDVESFAYKVPPDMSIIGKRYMTVEELDKYKP